MINMFDLVPGSRLELADGRQVTLEENMDDGMWVSVREDGSEETELTHSQDILRLIKD